jgi:AmmeMemoRadiSam system protein A
VHPAYLTRYDCLRVSLDPSSRVALLDLARRALRERLGITASAEPFPAPPLAADLLAPAGCFISLHELQTHRLRGCVGRLDPAKPLWETVYLTSGEVLHDPRFVNQPVTGSELESLELEISVLSPPREAANPLDFEPLVDGIYLTFANRAGFFLPQVARETGWTREQLLSRLCSEKLGLHPDIWQRPGVKLFKFEVEVVGPEPI